MSFLYLYKNLLIFLQSVFAKCELFRNIFEMLQVHDISEPCW